MPTPQTLTDQTALVTGGTRGIGRAVAAFLLAAGIHVVLPGTKRPTAEEVAAQADSQYEAEEEPAQDGSDLATGVDSEHDDDGDEPDAPLNGQAPLL